MPRYAHPDGRSGDVELNGRTLVVNDRVDTHVNPAGARDAYLAVVKTLLDDGFELDTGTPDPEDGQPPDVPRHPDLEHAIDADPDDRAGYAVYADFLQMNNDPWGTLIALQLAGKAAAAAAMIEHHVYAFMGDLSNACRYRDLVLDWHWGFIRRAKISCFDGASYTHEELTRTLLEHRFARLLDAIELVYGASSIDVLRTMPQARRLRDLVIRCDDDRLELQWNSIELPQLDHLEIHDADVVITLDHRELRHLRLWDARLRTIQLAGENGCPRLTIAELPVGDDLPSLLGAIATAAPAITDLGLAITDDAEAEAALRTLIASPLAARIRRLTLRFAETPTEAALGDHGPYVRGLDQLRFAGTRPLVRSREAIKAVLTNVKFS